MINHPKLGAVADGRLYRGVITGLTEAFVVDTEKRNELVKQDRGCEPILKPYLRGQDIKPWTPDWADLWLITIPSSNDQDWPWSNSGDEAENIFRDTYPAIHAHLDQFRDALIKRQDQGRFWWELRSCAYWSAFETEKIIWPDIAKLPRFCIDRERRYMGNTGYFIADGNDYLLGVLASWATWFIISKTAQPLRLRGDRWQFRLFTQFMEQLPIPDANGPERAAIGSLASCCNTLGGKLFETQNQVRHRLVSTFDPEGKLNQKAESWWELSLAQLGAALKTSFKLSRSPFANPQTADEWEPYLATKKQEVDRLFRELADAEGELNERVYRLFDLTPDEIKLLQREVEH